MPDMKGTELIRSIRREETINQLPIIVLTAYATMEVLLECIKAGATGFLVKPPRKNTLREELEKAKRIYLNNLNPRLCRPEEAHLLEDAILARTQL